MKKTFLQHIWDFIGIPFRLILFDQNWLPKFGWTTLEDERLNMVLPRVKGRLLDIGGGTNNLVKKYMNGIGVDVFDWGGGAVVVENTANLSFEISSFDTVSFVACLNHIPNREEVVQEAKRLLKTDGIIVITMIGNLLGEIGHKIWWYSEDKHRGGMVEGETGGMSNKEIITLLNKSGFELIEHKRFVYWMNNLLVFKKSS